MYATDLEGQSLTLGVSGMLWQRSLVMYDQETSSQWSQILGRAMAGPLAGTELRQIPAVMTDWSTWKKIYPNTKVLWLNPTAREYTTRYMLNRRRYVVGIVFEGEPFAWGLDQLEQSPVLNEDLGGQPVVLTFDRESSTTRMFSRRLDDQELTFESSPHAMTDRETNTEWEPTSGRALRGPLAGRHLKPMPAIMSTRAAWEAFHPDSQ